ncbi:MAG: hypothetical protein WCT77_00235 [Bacteroidota bacterium]
MKNFILKNKWVLGIALLLTGYGVYHFGFKGKGIKGGVSSNPDPDSVPDGGYGELTPAEIELGKKLQVDAIALKITEILKSQMLSSTATNSMNILKSDLEKLGYKYDRATGKAVKIKINRG